MKKKNLLLILMVVLMAAAMTLTACGKDDEMSDDEVDYLLNEGADIETTVDQKKADQAKQKNKSADNFYGTWEATSDEAKNLYGNLTITINEDGTFDANITDEEFSGNWEKTASGISYTSEILDGKIYYGPSGDLIFSEAESGVKVSLHKK